MPTLLKKHGFRVYFYSHEPNEPAHVHVDNNEHSAKFWITPLQLAWNFGYSLQELIEIKKLLQEHQPMLLEKWNEHISLKSR